MYSIFKFLRLAFHPDNITICTDLHNDRKPKADLFHVKSVKGPQNISQFYQEGFVMDMMQEFKEFTVKGNVKE